MPETHYAQFEKESADSPLYPVYLIYGEEMLYKTILHTLLDKILDKGSADHNYEPIDGGVENIHQAIELVNTFSLLSDRKVVAILDSRIFYAKHDETQLLEKAKAAYDDKEMVKAANYLMSLLGGLKLSIEDVDKENRERNLNYDSDVMLDDKWFDEVLEYCAENRLNPAASPDVSNDLQEAVDAGFPDRHHLIITTDIVDKRRGLYKSIKKKGMVIDCSAPKGERKADKTVQDAILKERMTAILSESHKTIEPFAYKALCEMTGFDLRTFTGNVEKLVQYTGERNRITLEDVESVLQRTKQDPIFELTNALADRNLVDTLFYLNSLLSAGYYPLQIMAAMTNLMRRLLMMKVFVQTVTDKIHNKMISFDQFKNQIMPLIVEHDQNLLEDITLWEQFFPTPSRKKNAQSSSDLVIAKTAGSPYPLYLMFQRSGKYSMEELLTAFEILSEADTRLKSSGQSPRRIVEQAIFEICNPGKPVESSARRGS